jgi:hypothetical protein
VSIDGLLLLAASLVSIVGGALHSLLGERYILSRLSGSADLPMLFGSAKVTTRVIRTSWHLTAGAFCTAGVLFFFMAQTPLDSIVVAETLAIMSSLGLIATLVLSRGRYIGWPILLFMSGIAFWGAHVL